MLRSSSLIPTLARVCASTRFTITAQASPYLPLVAGSLPSGEGSCQLYCAVIVKQVDAKTRAKTSINDLLRA